MPAAFLLVLALQSAPEAAAQLAEMHRAYEESCLQRDYGSFDDVCNQLSDQISAYERAHRNDRPPPAAAAPAAQPVEAPAPRPAAPAAPAGSPPAG